MFENDQVCEVIMKGCADKSFDNQNASTQEEIEIVSKLRGKLLHYENIFLEISIIIVKYNNERVFVIFLWVVNTHHDHNSY